MSIKESDITSSFKNVVEYIKEQVRNNVVLAHRKSLIKGLDDRTIAQICNIIDTSIDQSSSSAIGSEARGLYKRVESK